MGWRTGTDGGFVFDDWQLTLDDMVSCRAGAPDSALAPAMRLAEGAGWMGVLLAMIRIKLGTLPGERVLGGSPEADSLAKLTAAQLSQGARVSWIRLLFGDHKDTGARIRRLLDFDNPVSKNPRRGMGLYAAAGGRPLAARWIRIMIDGTEASWRQIGMIEEHLAATLSLEPWSASRNGGLFVGREKELEAITSFLGSSKAVLQVLGPGGRGKSALVGEALGKRADTGRPVFFWPFYRQGYEAKNHQPLWPFRQALDRFLGIDRADGLNGDRLAELWCAKVAEMDAILLLDGCEVMLRRAAPGEASAFDYPELDFLIRNGGGPRAKIILTSRLPVVGADDRTEAFEVEPMSTPEAGNLLTTLGVRGGSGHFKEAISLCEGQPLHLRVLAGLVRREEDRPGEPALARVLAALSRRPRALLGELLGGPEKSAAGRMLARHETLLAGTHELALLWLCCAFQHDPDPAALEMLLLGHDEGDTLRLGVPCLSMEEWLSASANLVEWQLASGSGLALSIHPVVQHHFAASLAAEDPALWNAIHAHLFRHYRDSVAAHRPRDLGALVTLLNAIIHGCLAGMADRVYEEIAFDRFAHGYEVYPLNTLGAVHEMRAGMEAVLHSLRERGWQAAGTPTRCALYNVMALSNLAVGDSTGAACLLEESLDTGFSEACRSQDAEFIGVQIFAILHRLRLVSFSGDFFRKGYPMLTRLTLLGTLKRKTLEAAQALARATGDYHDLPDYVEVHVARVLLDMGLVSKAESLVRGRIQARTRDGGAPVRLLPGLSARAHGECMIAFGQGAALREALRSGEAAYGLMGYEFGNTVSYLEGIAALDGARHSGSEDAGRFSLDAKDHLDEAVRQAAGSYQLHHEIPARLARAEWAVAARDEKQARKDITFVRLHASRRDWKTFIIQAAFLEARLFAMLGDGVSAAAYQQEARHLARRCGYRHPLVHPHLKRRMD